MNPDKPSKHTGSAAAAFKLGGEHPFDYSAFVSRLVLDEPEFVGSTEHAEQLPVLFWLCDVLQPKVAVDVGASDPTMYFGLCQALAQLPIDSKSYIGAIRLDADADEDGARIRSWIEHQNTHFGSFSQVVGGAHDKLIELFPKRSVDLLVLHADNASRELLEQWRSDLWPRLSRRSVVLVDGLGSGSAEFMKSLPDSVLRFQFEHGTGFAVFAGGDSPPALFKHLCHQADTEDSRTTVASLFAQLGAACRQAEDLRRYLATQKGVELLESELATTHEALGLREARLVHREAQILELRDQLTWHREQLDEAQQEALAGSAEIQALRDQLKQAGKNLADARELESQLRSELQTSKEILDREVNLLASLQAKTSALGSELADARKARAKAEAKRNQANISAEVLRNQLNEIYGSRSWKITAPLRRVMRGLRGG